MTKRMARCSGAALLAGAVAWLVLAPTVKGACNPPSGVVTEIQTFRVTDVNNTGNFGEATLSANPAKLFICGDSATIEMSATVSPGSTTYIGWRIEKESGKNKAPIPVANANPNEGNPYAPCNKKQSALTVGDPEVRQFYVKAFCDGNMNCVKDADEDYYYAADGSVIEVLVFVLKVELVRDIWGDTPLDDWPETSTQRRSPKYLFGNQEGIYVGVIGPAGLGNNYFKAQVTSESETSPVTIDLLEYAGSGGQSLYRNGTATPLRLGPDTTTVSGAKYIKIVEEELLSFSITANGTEVCTRDVVVDRGEFATGTARSFDERREPSQAPNRSPIWEDAADEFASDITDSWEADLDWWDVGNIRGTDDNPSANAALRCFIQQAGQNYLNHGEADLFYAQAHGDQFSVGDLLGTKKQAADPTKEELDTFLVAASDLSGIWNDDLDWAIIKSCSTLKHTGPGRARWEGALKNGRRAHGILGFEDPSASDYDGYVDDFVDEIGSGHTIITSWINGNTGLLVGDQPYGVVYHTENADDALRKAPDGVSLTADMKNDNFSYAWRNTNGITGTDAALAGEAEAQDFPVRWRGRMARRRVPVRKASGSFSVVRVKSWPFDVEQLRQGFELVRAWESGAVRLSRNIDLELPAVSREEAIRIAREFINVQKLPGDAVLRDAAPIQASNEISPEGQTVAYALSFGHSTNGLDICGDTLRLIVQTDGVKLFAGMWHSAVVDNSRSIPLRTFNAAFLQEAVGWLSARYGALEVLPDVEAVYPAYYVGEAVDGDWVVARVVWRIQLKNGLFGLIDPASSTKVVDYFKDDRGLRVRRRDRK